MPTVLFIDTLPEQRSPSKLDDKQEEDKFQQGYHERVAVTDSTEQDEVEEMKPFTKDHGKNM
jgi:hypothetical protein